MICNSRRADAHNDLLIPDAVIVINMSKRENEKILGQFCSTPNSPDGGVGAEIETIRGGTPYLVTASEGGSLAADARENLSMKRLASAFVALAVLAAPAAMAQGKMDCGKAYKGFWDKLEREKYAKVTPEQLAGVSRMALRAYDACRAGDELDAKALFEKLEKMKF
jgi:hypothetical protein